MIWQQADDSFHIKIVDGCDLYITAEQRFWGNSGIRTLVLLKEEESVHYQEEALQLLEGCSYTYELTSKEFMISPKNSVDIFKSHPRKMNEGRITPGIYVGRLSFDVIGPNTLIYTLAVEIRSVKAEYRTEYRTMLEDITHKCTTLLMSHASPTTQRFTVNHETSSQSLYQRFAFVRSIINSDEFHNAVYRVITMPVTIWKNSIDDRDVRNATRFSSSQLRQFASINNRIPIPENHPLINRFSSIPSRLISISKKENVDNPENRFIKHALKEFLNFCIYIRTELESRSTINIPIYEEAIDLENKISEYLNHSIFREITTPKIIPLNSPILQRKEGYREILRVWLMFDLAAKLCWSALDADQYHAGKRDVATLYEYWVFFKLLEIVSNIFTIPAKEIGSLVIETKDGMGLQLRQGRHTALSGRCTINKRNMSVKFSYNRTFNQSNYPKSGSWTQQMRPDYTLSIWPEAFSEDHAEEQELIVHVHFDAKYRVDGLSYLIDPFTEQYSLNGSNTVSAERQTEDENAINEEKKAEKEGRYKRADLLKMHAYKDAIRRTVGAYIIYPGTKHNKFRGFHEIIPGLGAFPLAPSDRETGSNELGTFIKEVVQNFTNRASHIEENSYYTYKINQQSDSEGIVNEALPEHNGGKRIEPINTTTVLVGYYFHDQYEWIKKTGLYNIRIDKSGGLDKYGPAETGAKYLLLHGQNGLESNDLWDIISPTPVLMSKEELLKRGYPKIPSKDYYLVYTIKKISVFTNENNLFDIRKLRETKGYGYTFPFSVTLTELLGSKSIKKNHRTTSST